MVEGNLAGGAGDGALRRFGARSSQDFLTGAHTGILEAEGRRRAGPASPVQGAMMRRPPFLDLPFAGAVALAAACTPESDNPADLVLRGGKVVTVDSSVP